MKLEQHAILYVDDDIENLNVFQDTFKLDYTIYIASSAEEGIEILKKEPVKLVITDHRISQTTGIDFLVRVGNINPDVVPVVLTGYSDAHDIIMTINKVNIYKYLTKPWAKEDVKSAIEESLQVYQTRINRKELIKNLEEKNRDLLSQIEGMEKKST
jgi:DNA-binding NtrC family response regulator